MVAARVGFSVVLCTLLLATGCASQVTERPANDSSNASTTGHAADGSANWSPGPGWDPLYDVNTTTPGDENWTLDPRTPPGGAPGAGPGNDADTTPPAGPGPTSASGAGSGDPNQRTGDDQRPSPNNDANNGDASKNPDASDDADSDDDNGDEDTGNEAGDGGDDAGDGEDEAGSGSTGDLVDDTTDGDQTPLDDAVPDSTTEDEPVGELSEDSDTLNASGSLDADTDAVTTDTSTSESSLIDDGADDGS